MNPVSSSVNSLAASVSPNDQIQVAVLKKALDSESQSAIALINALPPAPSINQPAHLGQNVNTSA